MSIAIYVRVVTILAVLAVPCATLVLTQGALSAFDPVPAMEPVWGTTVHDNLRQIATALYIYANENWADFPTRLSMLYPARVSDPAVFWNPGDDDPCPTTIDNDIPDYPNSAQISYAYYEGRDVYDRPTDIILQDNSLANNDDLGVYIVTVDASTTFFVRYDRWLPSSEIARANLEQIGIALHQYADNNGGHFPDYLSMLYPAYVADPAVFWNPGDPDPCPTTINNDTRNYSNSAAVSYEYFGAGYTSDCSDGLILVQDNSMSNNGGSSVNILTADCQVACFAPTAPDCSAYAYCRVLAASNLSALGTGLYMYANENAGMLPPQLSMLYPWYTPKPAVFWNPGDDDPSPLTIDNDIPNQPNSAQISFDYLAAGQNLYDLAPDDILMQDNTPANNGGYSVYVLYADGQVELLRLCNDPFADIDGDGDVDQSDFGVSQRCLTDDVWSMPPECECLDRPLHPWESYGDGDIDQDDLESFLACVSGPNIPANPDCDDE